VVTLASAVLSLGACGSSPPTRYYTLDAGHSGGPVVDLSELSIGVGPFYLPDLLDRPQIVVRGSGNEVIINEFERWADDMGTRFQAVVAQNLVQVTGSAHVYEHPWRDNFSTDYRILGTVDEFAANTSGAVRLKIRWVIQDGKGEAVLATREGVYTESADADQYGQIAAAMSRAIGTMATEMAGVLAETAATTSSAD
jgi:uncharacterized lipoprotein YmbA